MLCWYSPSVVNPLKMCSFHASIPKVLKPGHSDQPDIFHNARSLYPLHSQNLQDNGQGL